MDLVEQGTDLGGRLIGLAREKAFADGAGHTLNGMPACVTAQRQTDYPAWIRMPRFTNTAAGVKHAQSECRRRDTCRKRPPARVVATKPRIAPGD